MDIDKELMSLERRAEKLQARMEKNSHWQAWLKRGFNVPARLVEDKFYAVASLADALADEASEWAVFDGKCLFYVNSLSRKADRIKNESMRIVKEARKLRKRNARVPFLMRPLYWICLGVENWGRGTK